jgi:hypothetical protein
LVVGLACRYNRNRFVSCLECSSQPSTKYYFPHRTLFHIISPHRPATWTGSRAGSPVSDDDKGGWVRTNDPLLGLYDGALIRHGWATDMLKCHTPIKLGQVNILSHEYDFSYLSLTMVEGRRLYVCSNHVKNIIVMDTSNNETYERSK